MQYLAIIDGHEREVDLDEIEPCSYRVKVDGNTYTIDARRVATHAYSMIIDDEAWEVRTSEEGENIHLLVRGRVHHAEVLDERHQLMRKSSGHAQAEGRQVVKAPMPGRIVRVLVAVGDEVGDDTGVIVIEAMKMENELRSPRAGTVTKVSAAEGATVEAGAELVVIE